MEEAGEEVDEWWGGARFRVEDLSPARGFF